MGNEVKLFEGRQVRSVWDGELEKWWFSVVDVVGILTDSPDPAAYWRKLKQRLKEEGNQTVTNCHGLDKSQPVSNTNQLKMKASDGKMRLTDVLDTEGILRLVQSVPSPKAEPFKTWLAKTGYERMQEMVDPTAAIDRARETYKQLGYSDKWIEQRLTGQETRNKLTDYWKDHDIKKGQEFAILTNIIHQEWTGLSVKEHKDLKGLKSQNLRDHMSEAELIFTALAELSTRQIAETEQAVGMQENTTAAKQGGGIAKQARKQLENKTGKKVVTDDNHLPAAKQPKKITKNQDN
ncbi:MAG: Bro-N domain-containing protein [Heliobacteriaceae bacterium]|jgi:hypothetical protein|nr:Bro-N domain-containing protein [Heliobacteriaceae bacterium]